MPSELLDADLPSDLLIMMAREGTFTSPWNQDINKQNVTVSHDTLTSLAYLLVFRNRALIARTVCRLRCTCKEFEERLHPRNWPTGSYPVVFPDAPAIWCEDHVVPSMPKHFPERVHMLLTVDDHYVYRRDGAMTNLAKWVRATHTDMSTLDPPNCPAALLARVAVANRILQGCPMYPYGYQHRGPRTRNNVPLSKATASFTFTDLCNDTACETLTTHTVQNIHTNNMKIARREDNCYVAVGERYHRCDIAKIPIQLSCDHRPVPIDVLHCVRMVRDTLTSLKRRTIVQIQRPENCMSESAFWALVQSTAPDVKSCYDRVHDVYFGKSSTPRRQACDSCVEFVYHYSQTYLDRYDNEGCEHLYASHNGDLLSALGEAVLCMLRVLGREWISGLNIIS